MNTHSWTINSFSDVTEDALYSEVFKVSKVKWKLKLYPKGLNSGKGTHLSIFLAVHDAAFFLDGWKVYAKFKLRLKSEGTESDMVKEADGWFYNSVLDWGFSSFMLLSQLNDSENGFLLNDNLKVEVEISVIGTLKYFI
ncbi:hypothetical protein L1987_55266 [Smallanthus sonchifolius]|uniref:Uncharacterized protein n=1 Tax=Smallanthus sonchifolius TaxID=185202 RepID=A0ACB9E9W2_9ASTR|nr:hypothetical protein L1987_55266 [Smallanthus sonchifolius]